MAARNKVGIWELDTYTDLRQKILEYVRGCRDKSDYTDDVAIIVYGSYGRGKADPGSSDLDIDILTRGTKRPMEGFVLQGSAFDFLDCVEEVTESSIQEISGGVIRDVDVRNDIFERPKLFLLPALRREEPNVVYDLINEQQITLGMVEGRDEIPAGTI